MIFGFQSNPVKPHLSKNMAFSFLYWVSRKFKAIPVFMYSTLRKVFKWQLSPQPQLMHYVTHVWKCQGNKNKVCQENDHILILNLSTHRYRDTETK